MGKANKVVERMDRQAEAVYDILVEECGAPEWERERFVYRWRAPWREYRFCGDLGFGGKIYRTGGHLRVACYPEDMTDERSEMIRQANERLAAHPEGGGQTEEAAP